MRSRSFHSSHASSVVCPIAGAGLGTQKLTNKVAIAHLFTNEANKLLVCPYLQKRRSQFPRAGRGGKAVFNRPRGESVTGACAGRGGIMVPISDFTVTRGFVREWLAEGAG